MKSSNTDFVKRELFPRLAIWLILSSVLAVLLAFVFVVSILFGRSVGAGAGGVSYWWTVLSPAIIFGGMSTGFFLFDMCEGKLSHISEDILTLIILLGSFLGGTFMTWELGIVGTLIAVGSTLTLFTVILLLDLCFRFLGRRTR